MDEIVTYILFSKKYNKIYIGYSEGIIKRFYSHNYVSRKGYTLRYRPWVVLHVEFHKTKKQALRRELFLKSGKGRELIYNEIFPKYIKIGFISK